MMSLKIEREIEKRGRKNQSIPDGGIFHRKTNQDYPEVHVI